MHFLSGFASYTSPSHILKPEARSADVTFIALEDLNCMFQIISKAGALGYQENCGIFEDSTAHESLKQLNWRIPDRKLSPSMY